VLFYRFLALEQMEKMSVDRISRTIHTNIAVVTGMTVFVLHSPLVDVSKQLTRRRALSLAERLFKV